MLSSCRASPVPWRCVRSRVGAWVGAQQAWLDLAVSVAAQEVADLRRQLQT